MDPIRFVILTAAIGATMSQRGGDGMSFDARSGAAVRVPAAARCPPRLFDEMLAAAKANLEMEGAVIAEQVGGGDRIDVPCSLDRRHGSDRNADHSSTRALEPIVASRRCVRPRAARSTTYDVTDVTSVTKDA